MRNTGVRKTIDDLGRIVLPKEIRKSLGLGIRSAVDLYVDGEKLIITKTKNECIFCNSRDNLVEYKGKSVCDQERVSEMHWRTQITVIEFLLRCF